MNDDNDFDINNYYGAGNYNDDGYESNRNNQNRSSYDDVFRSYSSDNIVDNKKRKEKNRRRDYSNKNTSGGNIWVKIIVVVILTAIFVVGGIILFKSKDEIIDIINPSDDKPNIEVVLTDTNLSLIVGDERKLNYQIVNSDDVSLLTFTSSDPSVVKVDKEGNIKVLAAGEADILISYKSESGNVTKKCHIVAKNTDVNEIQVTPIPTSSLHTQTTQPVIDQKAIKEAEARAKQEAIKKAQEAALQKNREANQKAIEEAKKKAQTGQK